MKVLFVHIPKNAGTSISHALSCRKIQLQHRPDEKFTGRITFKHLIPKHFPEAAKPLIQNAFKFCFLRNPYDRAVSIWIYGTQRQKLMYEYFAEIEEYHNKASDKGRVFTPQSAWFEGIHYDFVGRYENIEEDVAEVKRLTEAPNVRFPHMNKSVNRTPDWEGEYDSKTYDLIRRMYKDDFEPLGYPM